VSDKTLREIEGECRRWASVSSFVIDLGMRLGGLASYAREHGCEEFDAQIDVFANQFANWLEGWLTPQMEAHHEQHAAVREQFIELERMLQEEDHDAQSGDGGQARPELHQEGRPGQGQAES
jgi:hypothetical protein